MIYNILNRGLINLSGKDKEIFLQSMTTNDIKSEFSYNLMLNPQGRYLFDFFVYNNKISENIYIDINQTQILDLIKKLNFYKLRSDVKIHHMENMKILYSDFEISNYIKLSLKTLKDTRNKDMKYISYLTDIEFLNLKNSLPNLIEDPELYMNDKYNFCVIDGNTEMQNEKSLPPDFSMEDQNAISYTKGCYVGQEVISRAKYQGKNRKKIYKAHLISGNNFEQNSEIILPIEDVSCKILSVYKNHAILQLRSENHDFKEINAKIGDELVLIQSIE